MQVKLFFLNCFQLIGHIQLCARKIWCGAYSLPTRLTPFCLIDISIQMTNRHHQLNIYPQMELWIPPPNLYLPLFSSGQSVALQVYLVGSNLESEHHAMRKLVLSYCSPQKGAWNTVDTQERFANRMRIFLCPQFLHLPCGDSIYLAGVRSGEGCKKERKPMKLPHKIVGTQQEACKHWKQGIVICEVDSFVYGIDDNNNKKAATFFFLNSNVPGLV